MNHTSFTDSFRLKQYTFDRSHFHDSRATGTDWHCLGYLISGYGKLVGMDPDVTVDLSPGDVFYIPKGMHYHSSWYADEQIIFNAYAFSYLPQPDHQNYDMQKVEADPGTVALVRDIPLTRPINSRTIGALYTAIAAVLPLLRVSSLSTEKALCEEAIRHMTRNPNLSIPEIAQLCHVSPSTVYVAFRHILGIPPNTQRQILLCDRAVELLTTTDRPIEEISASLGFSSSSSFRKILFAHTGQTPREIRKNAHTS